MYSKAQLQAKADYESKRVSKPISFNTQKEADLLIKIEEIKAKTGLSFSEWVKKKIEDA